MEENVEKKRAAVEMEIHAYEKANKQKWSSYASAIVGVGVLGLGLVVSNGAILVILGLALIVVGIVASIIGEVGSAKLPSLHRQLDALEKEESLSMVTTAPKVVGPQTRYCRHCGQTIAVDAAFCEKCGKKLI